MTPEDLLHLHRVGQPEPVGGARSAVVPVTTADVDAGALVSRLHLVTEDATATVLTRGRSAKLPAVDPAGTRVAFLRAVDDDGPAQLHILDLGGGEAEVVTDFPLGAGPARWLPDGSGLVVAVPLLSGFPSIESTAAESARRAAEPGAAIVTEDRIYRYWNRWLATGRIHHLFRIDPATGAVQDLTPGWDRLLSTDQDPVGAFDVSPDGGTIAVTADVAPSPRQRFQFAVHLIPLDGGEPALATGDDDLPAHQRRPRFSPDGSSLVFGVQDELDYYADPVRLIRVDLDTGRRRRLAPRWDRSAGGWEFLDEERLVLHAEDGGRLRIFVTAGDDPDAVEAPGSWHGPRPAGDIVWCRSESAGHPPEVAVIADGRPRVVSTFNDARLAELVLGSTEDLSVDGSSGEPVHVRLVHPPGFTRERQWPLVHTIHGGPHSVSADTWHWRWNTQLLAATGCVVASVNFHGSTSWGDGFTRSIRGAWGDAPAVDVLTATDHLVGLGYIDEARMAVAGGSYGGYLAVWLTTLTDRFACAVCHAGVTDLVGQWASDITAGREHAIGAVPWEDLDAVLRWSPLAHTDAMSTPTLVIHGEQDYRVVVTQGLALYGILKHKGVPARLVYYPDEGHWIESPHNSIHWYGEVTAWLERWLGTGHPGH